MTSCHPTRIGILGGSFNPVHKGHLMLAGHIIRTTDIDAVWLMLSPQNPLKVTACRPASDRHRLEMLRIATHNTPHIEPCDVELDMPHPSYTINSLRRLSKQYPDTRFSLIIGSDNWLIFDRWRDHDIIIRDYTPIIYPRPGYSIEPSTLPPDIILADAPTSNVSSTEIRNAIAAGKDTRELLPPGVAEYIESHNLYR